MPEEEQRTDAGLQADDEVHLRRCIELAEEALRRGDDPFGSVLVDGRGSVLAEALNREVTDDDPTAHPELELVRWAIAHLDGEARRRATVYTSGEHCPMCAAAHAWARLGRVVAAASSAQLAEWRSSWGLPAGPVAPIPFAVIAPGTPSVVSVAPFDEQVRELHLQAARRKATIRSDASA
ncbi:nucleoside deaminase [Microbacterium sp. 4R-513]|uniref:nucleoside deaminase n=1 Tax=Microbacterium sp. 4R-513 TaxID=2567934 RepID=UPI0013E121BE|nr:nucleoside deaminase [Microbacterium sp. 4R-513]QIG40971.1 nucleoside deaminase [Microbacterium sp. 4R-513]